MPYQHIEIESHQSSKRLGAPCGDAFLVKRTPFHTTIICADGIGSGIKAHIASQMNIARLGALLEGGTTLRDAFLSVVGTMSTWRDRSMPFSAFIVMRVLNEGTTTILNYEMPDPILLSKKDVSILSSDPLVVPAGVASEYHVHLHPDEGVLLMSDGIIQAGLGKGLVSGWTTAGVEEFLESWLGKKVDFKQAARDVMRQAQHYDGDRSGDDRTVLLAHCRTGQIVDLFTGPPEDRSRDAAVVASFLADESVKVVCGATSADIVARFSDLELEVEQRPSSFTTPPRYFMEGIDLVSEGAITLTQAYNILEEDLIKTSDRSAASDLAYILQQADHVRFTVGLARNPANTDIVYRKQGILARDKIVPLLADKLEKMGKLVTVRFV